MCVQVAMCEKLHGSGHRFLARVLQAALKDELDISELAGR